MQAPSLELHTRGNRGAAVQGAGRRCVVHNRGVAAMRCRSLCCVKKKPSRTSLPGTRGVLATVALAVTLPPEDDGTGIIGPGCCRSEPSPDGNLQQPVPSWMQEPGPGRARIQHGIAPRPQPFQHRWRTAISRGAVRPHPGSPCVVVRWMFPRLANSAQLVHVRSLEPPRGIVTARAAPGAGHRRPDAWHSRCVARAGMPPEDSCACHVRAGHVVKVDRHRVAFRRAPGCHGGPLRRMGGVPGRLRCAGWPGL